MRKLNAAAGRQLELLLSIDKVDEVVGEVVKLLSQEMQTSPYDEIDWTGFGIISAGALR